MPGFVYWWGALFFLAPAFAIRPQPACFEFQAPIHVSLPLTQYNIPTFTNSYESTGFLATSLARTADVGALVTGKVDIDRTYNISVQYCGPKPGVRKKGIVQILTHGLGIDKSYWNFEGDEYNYITSATAAGYSTLSYDRLGVGLSERPDPYFEVQVATQIAILAQLSELTQNGNLSPRIPIPKKIVHVGHSLGSLLVNALVASTPELADGVVLTGFSHNFSWGNYFQICWGFHLARLNNPARFHDYDSGYITWGDQYDNQCGAFSYPFFDPVVLKKAESQKSPFAIAELVTFGTANLAAPEFSGPVLMLSGEHDLSFCGGDCKGLLNAPDSPSFSVFPNATPLVTHIQPNAGHAVNLHKNASAAYSVISNFLGQNGL